MAQSGDVNTGQLWGSQFWDSETGTGEALAGLFSGPAHTPCLQGLGKEAQNLLLLVCISAPVALPAHLELLSLAGRKPGDREAAGQIPPSATQGLSWGKESRHTSSRDFCTSHRAGLAAETHLRVNTGLLGRYSVTSQSLSASTHRPAIAPGPTSRLAGGTVMPTQERCPSSSVTWHHSPAAQGTSCLLGAASD